MALQVSKDIENLAKAAEERRKQEEQGIGMAEAGLGLGGAAFAAQTGRTPAPTSPPKLSPLAQKIAAQDVARREAAKQAAMEASKAARGQFVKQIGSRAVPVLGAAATGYTAGSLIEGVTGGAPSSFLANIATGGEYGSPRSLPSFSEEELAQIQAGSNREGPLLGGIVDPLANIDSGMASNVAGSLFDPEPQAPISLPDAPTAEAKPDSEQRGILQEIVRSPVTLGETIGGFLGRQKYGTGIGAEGEITGRPLPEGTLPAQTATLGASAAELYDATANVLGLAGGSTLEYLTAQDIIKGGPVGTPSTGVSPSTPSLEGRSAAQRRVDELGLGRAAAPAAPAAPEVSTAQQNFLARQQQGTPLTAQEINAAKRYATSQGQIFDPETGYSQAEFYGQQYVGQSIGDYLRAVDEPTQKAEQARSAFERASAEREARIAARPDFMEPFVYQDGKRVAASEARGAGKLSDSQLRDMVGGGDALKRAKALQDAGRDPLTGQPIAMTEYQTETLRQNQERIDFAKEQAETARKTAEAKGATQAQKDAYDIAQKRLNYAMTYQDFLKDQEGPAFNAKDIEADLEGIEDQLDFVYDPEAGVFRKDKFGGKGAVLDINDPKNASIVRTIGTYKVGKALLDKYPKKG